METKGVRYSFEPSYTHHSSNSTSSPGFDVALGNMTTLTSHNMTSDSYLLPWYIQVLYIIPFTAMVVTAAAGNIIVIYIVVANRRMRTVTNFFLVNLAVADTTISVFNTFFNFIYMLSSIWPFGLGYCKFSRFSEVVTISASVFTFMAIAIDRYMAIIYPLRPRMTAKQVVLVVAVIWVISIAVGLPYAVVSVTYTFELNDRTICYANWSADSHQRETIEAGYSIFILVINYLLPLLIMMVTYTKVGVELWGSKAIGELTGRQLDNIKAKRKVVKMMVFVVVIFAICWLPQHIILLIQNLSPSLTEARYFQHVYLVVYWVAMSNSMYNPFVYCWMNQRFRIGFRYVFRWLPCVKWDPEDSLDNFGATTVRFAGQQSNKTKNNSNVVPCPYSNSSCAYKQCTLITEATEHSSA